MGSFASPRYKAKALVLRMQLMPLAGAPGIRRARSGFVPYSFHGGSGNVQDGRQLISA